MMSANREQYITIDQNINLRMEHALISELHSALLPVPLPARTTTAVITHPAGSFPRG